MNIKIFTRQCHGVCTCIMDLEYLFAYSNASCGECIMCEVA